MTPSSDSESQLRPAAAVLAWLWPGLGHISLGERKRGFLIMFGILFLFLSGLLVGGVDCVDRKNDTLWFCAQSVCGPIAFAADLANQMLVRQPDRDWRRDRALRRQFIEKDPQLIESLRRVGLGRVNEMGTLFIALAGLMNLVVILDAFRYRSFTDRHESPSGGARSAHGGGRGSADSGTGDDA